ncbi:uncharacterized protein LOC126424991 [Schistocerca serialis cubense]|uniref:uncharacterized protein LOC126424991 n=1 Tax=Schistocerca serialis cubense TaxID=2023355 RepID=UPI00214E4D79|nr:uncharacterized protein LOC126424991 [Schistocerca serialis cubense]XP_049943846.1 uncharacterized protein LOC126424991 [Schistocerca serialis cubense]
MALDEQTALVLSLQLVALCAVALGLLLYLVCRLRAAPADAAPGAAPACAAPGPAPRAVLVTSAETALGLQCALRLSRLGYRVFAGVSPPPDAYDAYDAGPGAALAKGIALAAESEDDDDDDEDVDSSTDAHSDAGVSPETHTGTVPPTDAGSEGTPPTGEGADPTPPPSDPASPLHTTPPVVATPPPTRPASSRGSRRWSGVLGVLRAAAKAREATGAGRLVAIPLDVTREDLLHEATDLVRAHLPAGEDGLWAVVNTSGSCCRGRLDAQGSAQWEQVLRLNVVGALRTARAFLPLLRQAKGRLVTVGASPPGAGLAATTAARYAVEGASAALRRELAPLGVAVVTLRPEPRAPGLPAEMLFAAPSLPRQIRREGDTVVDIQPAEYKYKESDFSVLTPHAMRILEEAISAPKPRDTYQLSSHRKFPSLGGLVTVLKKKISSHRYKPQIM